VGAAKPDVELSGGAYLRLVLLGAAIGIPAALVAAGFLAFVHWLEDRLWTDLPDRLGYASPPWFLVVGLPVVGASFVLLARTLLPGDGGHTPLAGIGGGVIRFATRQASSWRHWARSRSEQSSAPRPR
jgi:hypothetical protein